MKFLPRSSEELASLKNMKALRNRHSERSEESAISKRNRKFAAKAGSSFLGVTTSRLSRFAEACASVNALRGFCVISCLFVYGCAVQRAGAQDIRLPPFRDVRLSNGMRVLLMEFRRAPTLTVSAVFPGGSSVDSSGKSGTASLVAALLTKGTATRNAVQIAEEIDFLGGSLGAGAGDDRLSVSLGVLAKDADAGLDLFADVIRHPAFPLEEIERQRQLVLSELESLGENPGAVAGRVASETVFAGHPYGIDPTITSVKGLTFEDLLAYYRSWVIPNRMILVAVGDFQSADMESKVRSRFEDWPAGIAESITSKVPKVAASGKKNILIDKDDATQTQLRWVRTAIPRIHPDFFPAHVAETILGGGFTSRLVEEIRVNRSLTYDISSRFNELRFGGSFSVSSFTKIETTRKMLDAVRDVMKAAATSGFSASELKKAQGYLGGSFAIHVQTPEALAGELADIAFHGLPANWLETYLARIRAVTLADVSRVAKTWFDPDSLSLVLLAPAKAVADQLQGVGTFERRPVASIGR